MSDKTTEDDCPICGGTGIMGLRLDQDGTHQLGTCEACGGDGVLPVFMEDQTDD